jgi:hypothetical protein
MDAIGGKEACRSAVKEIAQNDRVSYSTQLRNNTRLSMSVLSAVFCLEKWVPVDVIVHDNILR